MTEPKYYKAKITFQQIGTNNKVKLSSKKMTEKSFEDLKNFLFKEFLFEEPRRVIVEELRAKLDKAVVKQLNGETDIKM